MQFGFTLELPDTDLWSIDLLDTHLDLLDTDVPSKYFVSLHSVFKTSSRYVFKASSRHVFNTSSTRLQGQQMFAGIVLSNLIKGMKILQSSICISGSGTENVEFYMRKF